MKKTIFISFSLAENSVSNYFVLLAEKFSQKYQVVIFSNTKFDKSIFFSDAIIVKYWPSARPTKIKDAFFLYKNLKKYNPILTLSIFGSVNIFLIIGFLCGIQNRIAWIRTLTTQFPQKRVLLLRKSLVYKLATKIITNSNATKEDAIVNYHVNEDKIIVLPNSVKNLYAQIKDSKTDNKQIVYVGRLHKSKGIRVLINSFFLVKEKFQNCKLIIVGSGEEEKKLKKLVNGLNLEESVYFKGNLSKIEVLEMFKNSYLAVVPSLSEAFGYTVIEAMSMKTLVIGSNNTGIKEIIQDSKSGLLFNTNDSEDLAIKMITALENTVLRNDLANQGYEHFLKNYELSEAIERDYNYFEYLINEA